MKWFEKNNIWATIPLRIALAVLFIAHGASKLFGGLEGTAGFFDKIGIPLAFFFAVVVGIVEFGGGILLLLGLFTRYSAALLSIVMIVAILTAHLGGGYELAMMGLGGSLALLFMGAGKCSLDEKCKDWCKKKKN